MRVCPLLMVPKETVIEKRVLCKKKRERVKVIDQCTGRKRILGSKWSTVCPRKREIQFKMV